MDMACKGCGSSFSTPKCHASRRKFCSHRCARLHRPKKRIDRTCSRCGKSFQAYPCRVKRAMCTRECGGPEFVWSEKTAYLLGLVASDGCLSKDNRRITVASKDQEVKELVRACVPQPLPIHVYHASKGKFKWLDISFTWARFRNIAEDCGIKPRKSLTMQALGIPGEWFVPFLRGMIDGDGHVGWHKGLRISVYAGSKPFLNWLSEGIELVTGIPSRVTLKNGGCFSIAFHGRRARIVADIVWSQNTQSLTRKNPFLRRLIT